MAEGILRHLAGTDYDVVSAGTSPKGVHPVTLEVLKESGIDASRQTSKDVSQFAERTFDYVITVCDRAKQQCPIFPGAAPIHWGFDDPAEADTSRQLETFRRVRDEIRHRIRLFLAANKD